MVLAARTIATLALAPAQEAAKNRPADAPLGPMEIETSSENTEDDGMHSRNTTGKIPSHWYGGTRTTRTTRTTQPHSIGR